MNILCKCEEKNKLRSLVINAFRKCSFVCNAMGNWPVEGTITSILMDLKGVRKLRGFAVLVMENTI